MIFYGTPEWREAVAKESRDIIKNNLEIKIKSKVVEQLNENIHKTVENEAKKSMGVKQCFHCLEYHANDDECGYIEKLNQKAKYY